MIKKGRHKAVNLKINTRIVLTSVLAIVIPVIIISIFSGMFINMLNKIASPTSEKDNSYGLINQIQWEQTVDEISTALAKDENSAKADVKKLAKKLEELGSFINIDRNGEAFYSCSSKADVLKEANAIVETKTENDFYHFGKKGVVIVFHTSNENGNYEVILVNSQYNIGDVSGTDRTIKGVLTNRTIIVISSIVLTFILAIIVISLITSKTIVGPIKKITRGANEIANGNLDYQINYHSTNELGQLADSFNEMRLRVKASAEERQRASEKQGKLFPESHMTFAHR